VRREDEGVGVNDGVRGDDGAPTRGRWRSWGAWKADATASNADAARRAEAARDDGRGAFIVERVSLDVVVWR